MTYTFTTFAVWHATSSVQCGSEREMRDKGVSNQSGATVPSPSPFTYMRDPPVRLPSTSTALCPKPHVAGDMATSAPLLPVL
jgi:hypothetical protein